MLAGKSSTGFVYPETDREVLFASLAARNYVFGRDLYLTRTAAMISKDIPPDAPGIPWDVWYEQQIERIFAEAREKRQQLPIPAKTTPEKTKHSAGSSATPDRDDDWQLLEISPYDE